MNAPPKVVALRLNGAVVPRHAYVEAIEDVFTALDYVPPFRDTLARIAESQEEWSSVFVAAGIVPHDLGIEALRSLFSECYAHRAGAAVGNLAQYLATLRKEHVQAVLVSEFDDAATSTIMKNLGLTGAFADRLTRVDNVASRLSEYTRLRGIDRKDILVSGIASGELTHAIDAGMRAVAFTSFTRRPGVTSAVTLNGRSREPVRDTGALGA